MSIEIKVPVLGESVVEATVVKWMKNVGEKVNADEPIVELETDKVSLEVPSPKAGVLSDIVAQEGDTVEVDAILALLQEGAVAAAEPKRPIENKNEEKIQNRKDASILNTLILQAMQRAEYTTENIGHFGLKYKKYTHFTSPIRRYPDLLVHRLIIATLSNEAVEDQELQGLLEYCSAQEKSAEFASKQVIQNLLCEYAANFKGKSFKGFITGVKDFGLFVDVPKLFTSGLLHVNDLPNDYYRYNARNYSLEGKRRGNKFSLGDEINIYIGDVRELEGKISLYY